MESRRAGVRAGASPAVQTPERRRGITGVVLRTVATGIVLGLLLAFLNVGGGSLSFPARIPPYIAVALLTSFLGWGAEHLWSTTIAGMLHHPSSWLGVGTCLPFWSFAGGIGLTLGLLLLKKFGVLDVHDIPVKPLFVGGEILGIITLAPGYLVEQWRRK